jgi:ribosome-associated toxin RatA of RatAB toxin-antitoxin module
MFYKILITALLLFVIIPISKAQNFEVSAVKNGITVESRKLSGYASKEIRSSMMCKSTPEEFIQTLMNFGDYPSWVPSCSGIKVIQKLNDTEFLYHLTLDVPFIENRDMVIRFIKKPLGNNSWQIDIKSDNKAFPPYKDHIRIERFVGIWQVKKISDTQIYLLHQNVYDIGGSVPGFIINMAGTKTPMETFEKLKAKLEM